MLYCGGRGEQDMKPGDIDLMDLSQFDHGVPHEYLGVLRREDPVHWQDIPGGQGFYAITKHADLRHISRNPQMFSSWKGGTNLWDRPEEELGGLRSMMLNMDPPQHVKYRRLVQPGFTPKMVALLEPRIREAARAVLDAVVDKNECDFVTELASELPLVLICELMGIPQEKRQDIFEWSNTMIGFDDPELSGDGQMGAAGKMWMYANELAASKRTNPDDSLVSKMINGSVDGDQISELEFNNFFVLLSVAGNETTRTVTTHGMRLLMEHRDQYDLLQAHPEHIPTAVEEFLRYNPPVIYFQDGRQGRDVLPGGEPRRRGVRRARTLRRHPGPEPAPVVRDRRALLPRRQPRAHAASLHLQRDPRASAQPRARRSRPLHAGQLCRRREGNARQVRGGCLATQPRKGAIR
jgi:cholest-4-en-3-one 26-monooxygenase